MTKSELERSEKGHLLLFLASFLLSAGAIYATTAAFNSPSMANEIHAGLNNHGLTDSTKDKPIARRTISGHAYEMNLTFDEFLNFPQTRFVFEGTIERVLEPRYVPNRVFEHVYSPVIIRITSMYKGEKPPDGRFVIKAFGGIANNVEFISSLDAADELTTVGTEVLVIAPNPMRHPDSTMAAAALAVYTRTGDTLRNITYAHSGRVRGGSVPLEHAQALLETAVADSGSP